MTGKKEKPKGYGLFKNFRLFLEMSFIAISKNDNIETVYHFDNNVAKDYHKCLSN